MNPIARISLFREMHHDGCFVMPNPWDVGTARWLRGAGFKALATTSAGFAFSQGRADQDVPLEMMLAHIAEIVEAVPDLPVNADFENGYADSAEGVARNVLACAATGVAGLSIEDATGRSADPLYPETLAIERIIAAREALDQSGSGVMLTARAEGLLTNAPGGIADVAKRIEAFAAAGADVLFAPGIKTPDDIRTIVAAAAGRPVNMVMFGALGMSVADVAGLGVRRISTGAALARAAWAGLITATDRIMAEGNFSGFAGNGVTAPLNPFFHDDLKSRGGA